MKNFRVDQPSKVFRSPVARGLAASSGPGVSGSSPVDPTGGAEGAGLIRGMAVITRGEASGHDLWIDAEFLQAVADAINADEIGAKARFTHPGLSGDGLGKLLGRVRNATVEGDIVRADLHLAQSARITPDGNLAQYVLRMAADDPKAFGNSIAFAHDNLAEVEFLLAHGAEWGIDDEGRRYLDLTDFVSPDPLNTEHYPHCRLAELRAVDAVDEPAANPEGLFAVGQELPREAELLLDCCFGVSDKIPKSPVFGVDPQRVVGFFRRYLDRHQLKVEREVSSMTTKTKKLSVGAPPEETPKAPKPDPATDPAPVPEGDPPPETEADETPVVPPEDVPVEDPPEEPSTTDPVPESDPNTIGDENKKLAAGPGQKFLDAFGDRGGRWFAEGKSFEECEGLFRAELLSENKSIRAELAELKSAVVELRGANPVSQLPAGDKATPEQNSNLQNLGPKLGKFANGIAGKMPGAK